MQKRIYKTPPLSFFRPVHDRLDASGLCVEDTRAPHGPAHNAISAGRKNSGLCRIDDISSACDAVPLFPSASQKWNRRLRDGNRSAVPAAIHYTSVCGEFPTGIKKRSMPAPCAVWICWSFYGFFAAVSQPRQRPAVRRIFPVAFVLSLHGLFIVFAKPAPRHMAVLPVVWSS